jgi:hypothetical protein
MSGRGEGVVDSGADFGAMAEPPVEVAAAEETTSDTTAEAPALAEAGEEASA